MQFYHKDPCGGQIVISDCVIPIFYFGLTDQGISLNVGDFIQHEDCHNFFCLSCENKIKAEDLIACDSHTRNFHPIGDLYKVFNTGGYYTIDTIRELELTDRRRTKLETLLSRVIEKDER